MKLMLLALLFVVTPSQPPEITLHVTVVHYQYQGDYKSDIQKIIENVHGDDLRGCSTKDRFTYQLGGPDVSVVEYTLPEHCRGKNRRKALITAFKRIGMQLDHAFYD